MDRILIIQDSPSINMLLKARLELAGFLVETAESGEEGIKKAQEARYQVILLDYSLPDRDGTEVCRILKSREQFQDTAVVFMSAKDEDEIARLAKASGAEGFIGLPFEGKELAEKIRAFMKKA